MKFSTDIYYQLLEQYLFEKFNWVLDHTNDHLETRHIAEQGGGIIGRIRRKFIPEKNQLVLDLVTTRADIGEIPRKGVGLAKKIYIFDLQIVQKYKIKNITVDAVSDYIRQIFCNTYKYPEFWVSHRGNKTVASRIKTK